MLQCPMCNGELERRCEEDIETDDGIPKVYWCGLCHEHIFLREDNAEE